MYRKWSTFVLLALATPTFALAQSTGKLQGRVIERGDDAGLPGVTVTIEGTGLGAVTDIDGNYTILGIPVGRYNVRAEFAGFNPGLVTNVVVNSNSTTVQNFTLTTGPIEDEIVVEYEKPIIQNDAITTGRSIQAEQLENLPVRGVNAVAATQAGVVDNGSGALNIRGGRSEEVSYYVDGVRVIGNLGVPQQAIQEQELILGTIPARYGDAMAGVINITTKSGLSDRYFGSAEAITSQFLDPYGYNLGSLSLGGPIVRNRATFFVSGEGTWRQDSDPYRGDVLRLSDANYAALQASPQSLLVTKTDGSKVFLPIPGDLGAGTSFSDYLTLLAGMGQDTTGVRGGSFLPVNTAETFTRSDFETASSKRQPSNSLALAGNVTVRPFGTMNLRLGGSLGRTSGNSYSYTRSLYNDDRYNESERNTWRLYADLRQSFNQNKGFYQINASYSDDQGGNWARGFGNDIRNTLFYGDIDGLNADGSHTMAYDLNAVARRYYLYSGGTFRQQYTDGSLPASVYGIFSLPGSAALGFSQYHNQQTRLTGSITNQMGIHQLEAGFEYENSTRRAYSTGGAAFAKYYKDGNTDVPQYGVDRYDQLAFEVVRPVIGAYYGYDYLGLNEVNSSNIDRWSFNVADTVANGNIAPWKPYYYAGYIQDKIEYRDLVIQVGFRADVFNTNTKVLLDPYAVTPIVRVSDLSGVTVPGNIGSDYAVYFAGGNATKQSNGTYQGTVLGYRDLEGVYYTPDGQRTTQTLMTRAGGSPQVEEKLGVPISEMLRDSKTGVTLMPRVGVSFPVTDQALFFASYNVTSQRPSEAAFYPAEMYSQLGVSRISNPNLKPEKTTQYEIGFRQRLGERMAIQLSGFYRTQTNKIGVRTVQNAYPSTVNGYASYFNIDFTTTKGASVEFDLRRTRGVQLNANYTLSFAQGTGSDANTSAIIAWRGNYYPDFLTASDFDRRHSLNVNLDYRLGTGEGPMIFGRHLLENFGVNVLGVVQSGLPYTRLVSPTNFSINSSYTSDVTGALNGAYTPWTSRIDLRVDRDIAVGARAKLNLFLNVQNLLNARNVLGVYRNTGLANTDGFLDGTAGQQAAANSVDAASYIFHYNYATSSPNGLGNAFSGARAIGAPRLTRLGLRLNF